MNTPQIPDVGSNLDADIGAALDEAICECVMSRAGYVRLVSSKASAPQGTSPRSRPVDRYRAVKP